MTTFLLTLQHDKFCEGTPGGGLSGSLLIGHLKLTRD